MGEPGDIVSLRITLRYRDLTEFTERYAENVSSAGLFIRTRAPKPAGTRVRFELLLVDGTRALRGEGVVVGARNDDRPGMSLRFNALEPASRALVDRIVARHGEGRLAPTPLGGALTEAGTGDLGPRPSWRSAGGLSGPRRLAARRRASTSNLKPAPPPRLPPPARIPVAAEAIDASEAVAAPPSAPSSNGLGEAQIRLNSGAEAKSTPSADEPEAAATNARKSNEASASSTPKDEPRLPPDREATLLDTKAANPEAPAEAAPAEPQKADERADPAVGSEPPRRAGTVVSADKEDEAEEASPPSAPLDDSDAPEETIIDGAPPALARPPDEARPGETKEPTSELEPAEATGAGQNTPEVAPEPAEATAWESVEAPEPTPDPAEAAWEAVEAPEPGPAPAEASGQTAEDSMRAPVAEAPAGASLPAPNVAPEKAGPSEPEATPTDAAPPTAAAAPEDDESAPSGQEEEPAERTQPLSAAAIKPAAADEEASEAQSSEDRGPLGENEDDASAPRSKPEEAVAQASVDAEAGPEDRDEAAAPETDNETPVAAARIEVPSWRHQEQGDDVDLIDAPAGSVNAAGETFAAAEGAAPLDGAGDGEADDESPEPTIPTFGLPPPSTSSVSAEVLPAFGVEQPASSSSVARHEGPITTPSSPSLELETEEMEAQTSAEITVRPAGKPSPSQPAPKAPPVRFPNRPVTERSAVAPASSRDFEEEEPTSTDADSGPPDATVATLVDVEEPDLLVLSKTILDAVTEVVPAQKAVDKEAFEEATEVPAMAGPRIVIALDIGREWLRLGYIEAGVLELIPLRGLPQLPAVVAARPDGQLVLGSKARTIEREAPERAVRLMDLLEGLPDSTDESRLDGRLRRDEAERLVIALGDRNFDAADILVTVLRTVRRSIVDHLGHAHFRLMTSTSSSIGDADVAALRSALREAELEAFRIESGPQCLLRAYHLEEHPLDTAVTIEVEPERLTLALARRGTSGLRVVEVREHAQGTARELDEIVARLALETFAESTGEDHGSDPEAVARTMNAAEAVRGELRRAATLQLRVNLAPPGGAGGVAPERLIEVPRASIEENTRDFVARVCRETQALLQAKEVNPFEVGAIVMAGNAGHFPPLLEAIGSLFGREPLASVPVSQVKLLGLARSGKTLQREENARQPDALAASVGIELPGGRYRPLIHGGSKLPIHLERHLPTTRENQTQIELHLLQGDGEVARLCTSLGRLVISGLPRGPRGSVDVVLQLDVDVDGVLKAVLRDPNTGRRHHIEVATKQTPPARRRSVSARAADPDEVPRPARGLFQRWFGG